MGGRRLTSSPIYSHSRMGGRSEATVHYGCRAPATLGEMANNELDARKFLVRDGILLYKQKVVLGQSSRIKAQVLQFVHSDPMAGHSGYDKTLQRARRDFYWKGMRKEIKRFIRECDVCQQNKHENTRPAGLL